MRWAVGTLVFSLAVGTLFQPAHAISLYEQDGKTLDLLVENGGLYAFSSMDFTRQNRDEVDWVEGYSELGLNWTLSTGSVSETYGGVSLLGTITRGEGDPGGTTTGEEENIDLENAYLGFKTQTSIFGNDVTIDISGGSQSFEVGNGFLITNDSANAGNGFGPSRNRGGAFLLNPREAFRRTAIARLDPDGPWEGELFYLDSTTGVQGETDLAGGHVAYKSPKRGRFGATYARVLDLRQDLILLGNGPFRRDLNTTHGYGEIKPGLPGMSLNGGASYQWGTPSFRGREREVDAYAWYAGVKQAFPVAKMKSVVEYQFTAYSGDDPGTAKLESFDALFNGQNARSNWLFGIIAGFFTAPSNQNANIHNAKISLYPNRELEITAEFLHFSRRETRPGQSDDLGNEFDLYAFWRPYPGVTIVPAYAFLQTGDSLERGFGTTENAHFFSAAFVTRF
jgi:hypothetical protein